MPLPPAARCWWCLLDRCVRVVPDKRGCNLRWAYRKWSAWSCSGGRTGEVDATSFSVSQSTIGRYSLQTAPGVKVKQTRRPAKVRSHALSPSSPVIPSTPQTALAAAKSPLLLRRPTIGLFLSPGHRLGHSHPYLCPSLPPILSSALSQASQLHLHKTSPITA